ncbi:relaxase/mobilization nuclease domain-containing protein [Pelagibius sp. Alg239-R121]|uniref:relaxase/mobilization nuclease domain-containing protein n=1 Tax=Pelagibius sp. Alg239-R121 TaxID=2993448 RepID=UPI0024A62D72|nr:relaxase/mobilization nuclease domain-containing protein [Pelagibius sp. Alg239-R121]
MARAALDIPQDELTEMFFGAPDSADAKRTRGRRGGTGGGQAYRQKTASAGSFIHNALLTHQAVLKIVRNGTTNGGARLAAQLQYISRDGNLDLENGTNLGAVPRTEEGDMLRDVIADWEQDFERMDPRTKFYTYHLIVSYPQSVDQVAARIAGEDFAARLSSGDYGDRYKYVLAHHSDTRNPHTHIVINRAGQGGKTLHLSRHGIDIQSLRDLHVETAREVGVRLAATSRFSRGVQRRPTALGRVKAAEKGRGLPDRVERSQPAEFPFYGGGRRQEIPAPVLMRAREGNRLTYQRLFGGLSSARTMSQIDGAKTSLETIEVYRRAVAKAAERLSQGQSLERNDRVAEQSLPQDTTLADARSFNSATAVPNPEEELQKINQDMRILLDGMAEKVAKIGDEDARTNADVALAKVRHEFEPLMTEDTRNHFNDWLQRDRGEVSRDDNDPVRQRRAAVGDARDSSHVQSLEERGKIQTTAPLLDERGKATQARLKEADSAVTKRFDEVGLSGALALQRITAGADVDEKTRSIWLERDIKTHANAGNLSDDQARKEVMAAYRDAASIYRNAGEDIRGINRDFADPRARDRVETGAPRGEDPSRAVGRRELPIAGSGDAAGEKPRRNYEAGISGRITEVGEALYQADNPKSLSHYIDLDQGADGATRIWGAGLPDMLERHGLQIGDRATVYSPGSEDVTVTEADAQTGEVLEKEVQRRQWEARHVERADNLMELKRSVSTDRKNESAREGGKEVDKSRRRDEDRGINR